MKIKNLMLKNFAKVSEISVNFDENITYLIGTNGAGKTTIGLNGIWFVMKGLAQKGDGVIAERFRFIGPHGRSAKGVMTIVDSAHGGLEIKISRKLLKNSIELKIEASDGRQLDQKWLDSIFNSFLIDPVGFSRLSGKAQALEFGADTAKFDIKKKELYQERLLIGRDVERLQGVVDTAGNPEEVEEVSVSRLMDELDKRVHINETNDCERNKLKALEEKRTIKLNEARVLNERLEALKKDVKQIKGEIRTTEESINGQTRFVANLVVDADEEEVRGQINAAQETNKKAVAYEQFLDNKNLLAGAKSCYESGTSRIQKNDIDRTKYLQSLNLPWPNISINDEGEFRLNGKPFKDTCFSTGEILKFGARIGSKLKDGLKYVYFPCSNNMDDKNREATFKTLVKEGFQVVAEFVGTEKKKDASILLKEMKVVESYDESAGDGLK